MSKGNAGLLALCILLAGAAFITLFVAPRYLGSEPSASSEKTVAAASVTGNGSDDNEAGESADAARSPDADATADDVAEGEVPAEGETDMAARDSGAGADAPGPGGEAEASRAEPVDENTEPTGENTEEATGPGFDVLRVEPDGSTVIAGRAAPGSRLEILDGEKVVATADVNESGDFAVVFDEPLSAGDHELRLRATTADGDETVSDEVATVSVPTDKDGELLAMVTEPGAASRIMTAPQSEKGDRPGAGNPADDAAADQNEEGAASDDAETSMSGSDVPAEEGEAATDEPAAPPEIAALDGASETAPEEAERPEIHIDAVEVEGDALFVTGSARPNTTVRIYAGDRAAGDDDVGEEGRFLVEESLALAVGEHEIRADMIEDGKVIARAIVPFFRPQEDAAAAVADLDMAGDEDAGTETAAEENRDASVETAANENRPAATSSAPAAAASTTASMGDTGGKAASTADDVNAAESGTEMAATEGDSVATFRQAPLEPSEASVIIRRGDTLWQISRRVYGQGVRYTTIYLANSDQIANPDLILPGQIFALPEEALANSAELHRERMSSN